MPWKSWKQKPHIDTARLDRVTDELLRTKVELQVAERHRVGLKIALTVRAKKIEQLTAQVDRLRKENAKLEIEAEHLTAIIKSEGFVLHANPQGHG
jgi:cell division protein FtsB